MKQKNREIEVLVTRELDLGNSSIGIFVTLAKAEKLCVAYCK